MPFNRIYGTHRFWFRPTNTEQSRYEVIKLEPVMLDGRRKTKVYSKTVNLLEYDARTVIQHWTQNDRNWNDAYHLYRDNINFYKGDMAYRIADTLGLSSNSNHVTTLDTYDDLVQYMRDIQAQNFSLVDFVHGH